MNRRRQRLRKLWSLLKRPGKDSVLIRGRMLALLNADSKTTMKSWHGYCFHEWMIRRHFRHYCAHRNGHRQNMRDGLDRHFRGYRFVIPTG